MNLKLNLCYLSFQNKIKIFQRDILSKTFYHFLNVRMKTNAFQEEAIADHKVENYKNTLQDYGSSRPNLTICKSKYLTICKTMLCIPCKSTQR